jgi:hypothetical protein
MATTRKRTTRKTGNFSKRTTTISSRGTTQSYSSKPPLGATRRTVSFNHKTEKTRTTYATKLGGGYIRTYSKTTGGSKYRPTKSRGRSRGGAGGDMGILAALVVGIFVLAWNCFAFVMKSFWETAMYWADSEKYTSYKNGNYEYKGWKDSAKYLLKCIGYFIFMWYVVIVLGLLLNHYLFVMP